MTDRHTGPDVLVTQAGSVQVISINRPDQRNAMTREAGLLIGAALDELDGRDDLQVGVLTGVGGTFCAGMDLKKFLEGESATLPEKGFGGLTRKPPRKVLVAAVEGFAVGGGFELALACDLIVAGRGSSFGLPEVKRGLAARAGGLLRLPSKVPHNIAMELILTGDLLDAERAKEIGLVNKVVDTGAALEVAIELATTIAANAPLALQASKSVVLEGLSSVSEAAWHRQDAMLDPLFESEDAREGATAFTERRPPRWAGR